MKSDVALPEEAEDSKSRLNQIVLSEPEYRKKSWKYNMQKKPSNMALASIISVGREKLQQLYDGSFFHSQERILSLVAKKTCKNKSMQPHISIK